MSRIESREISSETTITAWGVIDPIDKNKVEIKTSGVATTTTVTEQIVRDDKELRYGYREKNRNTFLLAAASVGAVVYGAREANAGLNDEDLERAMKGVAFLATSYLLFKETLREFRSSVSTNRLYMKFLPARNRPDHTLTYDEITGKVIEPNIPSDPLGDILWESRPDFNSEPLRTKE